MKTSKHLSQFLTLLFLIFLSCNGLGEPEIVYQDIAEWSEDILALSSSVLSKGDDFMVRFSHPVVSDGSIDKQIATDMWSLSPKASVECYWADASTLVFRPDPSWKSGQKYKLELQTSGLQNMRHAGELIQIEFETKAMRLEIQTTQAYRDENGQMRINGRIESSDHIPLEDIKSMLSVQQSQNEDIYIGWGQAGLKYFPFSVLSVDRQKKASTVVLRWDGRSFDPDFSGQRRIDVLSEREFSVLSVQTKSAADRRIDLHLSDPVDPDLDLDGLLYIQGYTEDLEIQNRGSLLEITLPQPVSGSFVLILDPSLQSVDGKKLQSEKKFELSFGAVKPQIRLVGTGTIVPDNERVIFPFESVNLGSVEVEVFQIFDHNILQFLQQQSLSDSYGLNFVGRIVHYEVVDLEVPLELSGQWSRHTLDLKDLVYLDPGSLYQVRLGFRPQDRHNFPCEGMSETEDQRFEVSVESQKSIMSRFLRYDQEYDFRDDPCHPNYYNQRRYVSRNVVSSDIAIIAKCSPDHTLNLYVQDILHVEPLSGVEIKIYNYQKQELLTTATDLLGKVEAKLPQQPAFVVARKGNQYGYLRLMSHTALDLTDYNVSGQTSREGIDGVIYGERGVWRPGDTMHLFFVLEDRDAQFPVSHPITWTVKDPRGQSYMTHVSTEEIDGIYSLRVPISATAPTGNWPISVEVGNFSFRKNARVETVKPNRLKINIDLPKEVSLDDFQSFDLSSEWLHGAPASGLQASILVSNGNSSTTFDRFPSYIFDDFTRRSTRLENFNIYNDVLDDQGKGQVTVPRPEQFFPAGKLALTLDTKVFEKSGDYSQDYFSFFLHPYTHYVGLDAGTKRYGRYYLPKGQESTIRLASVDMSGEAQGDRSLTCSVYKAEWHWWYERSRHNLYRYRNASSTDAIFTQTVSTEADGTATVKWKPRSYGSFLIKVCDSNSGHCTSTLVHTGWGGSRNADDGPRGLHLEASKEDYEVGEDIILSLPEIKQGKFLISVEASNDVLRSFWVEADPNVKTVEIPVTKEMHPNVYIYVHQVQPHNDGSNELPLRMYGVLPLVISDPALALQPQIQAPDMIRPEEPYEIVVSEEEGRAMTYTLAVVDEGLLDLTRFETPNLSDHFHSKEALQIRTWDLYDDVLDGYGGALDRYISIGGGGPLLEAQQAKKANRFPPVVDVLGPFRLEQGKKRKHELNMSNYMGAVRTMVVARQGEAYGSAEQSIKVRNPVMVLASAPRILCPGDQVNIGANVFALEDEIRRVDTELNLLDGFEARGQTQKQVLFDQKGDQLVTFAAQAQDAEGIAQFEVVSKGGGEKSRDRVELDIRNPLLTESTVESFALEAGDQIELAPSFFGVPGSNSVTLEVSVLPALNLEKRLQYLIQYPYGCIEQTTSNALAQLSLPDLVDLNSFQSQEISSNVRAAISRLQSFSIPQGGLSYWPGSNSTSEWGTSYVLFFLAKAKQKGYHVDQQWLESILSFQKNRAAQVKFSAAEGSRYRRSELQQAYRLLSLCLHGESPLGAMNRMRRVPHLDFNTRAVLAHAYAVIGQDQVALEMMQQEGKKLEFYQDNYYTFGSITRDQCLLVQSYMACGMSSRSATILREVAEKIGSERWFSTHSLAYALTTLSDYVEENGTDQLQFEWSKGGETFVEESDAPIWSRQWTEVKSGRIAIRNTSGTVLNVRHIVHGKPSTTKKLKSVARGLSLDVSYQDEDGNTIDPSLIDQGTKFVALVRVNNPPSSTQNLENVALSQLFPAGWQIENDRMKSGSGQVTTSYDYRDIRDDRVYTFFDLPAGKTKEFKVGLVATYAGDYYYPPTSVEAMYDDAYFARTESSRCVVR